MTADSPRILAVDDDPGLLRVVDRVVAPRYAVTLARGFHKAVEILQREEPFDIALLDIRMPDGDGYELGRRVRQEHPETDVILMTGSVTHQDQKLMQALDDDVFFFLLKPFHRRVLLALIERCLRQRQLDAENRRHRRQLMEDQTRAREIQHHLLPATPCREAGWKIDARFRSCDETSGDYYDYFVQPDGQLVLMIGDVTGHGVGPAILMAETRAYCRALLQADCSLVQLVGQMNVFLHRDTEAEKFITFMACRYDPEDRTLEYVGAGHEGVLVRRDGSTVTLHGSTIPLGLTEELPGLRTATVLLHAGDTLCLYTDGILESQSESGELFGKGRFLNGLIELRAQQPRDLLEGLIEEVSLFMQKDLPSDDQTAVILRID